MMRTRRQKPGRTLRRLGRDRSGGTALEFALVALPFFLLILALLEYGYVYLIEVSLDNATISAERLIRTGQLQTSGAPTNCQSGSSTTVTSSTFKCIVCSDMVWVPQCSTSLQLDVEVYSTFANESPSSAITSSGTFNSSAMKFDMGSAGDIIMVRTFLPWTMITPALFTGMTKLNGNQVLLQAISVFRNEPYS